METAETIYQNMAYQTGTSQYIQHSLNKNLVFTDGINQLREDADCHWLIDLIAIQKREEEKQQWKLIVNPDNSALLTMRDMRTGDINFSKVIPLTDFPLPDITLYVEEGGYGSMDNWTKCLVLMIPNER